jgi:hypothetical protein
MGLVAFPIWASDGLGRWTFIEDSDAHISVWNTGIIWAPDRSIKWARSIGQTILDITLTGIISTLVTGIGWTGDVCTARVKGTGSIGASLFAILTLA